ncbi:response regulator transcription factor [Candidatus Bipolaricaulota bacterium]
MEPIRILICDRDQDTVKHLADSLRAAGHEVIAVDRASRAKALVADRKPDLVILDVQLGGSVAEGWALLSEVRKGGIDPAVIVVTKLHRVDDRIRALTLGADDCVLKPFHPEELKARIQAVFRRMRPTVMERELSIDDPRKEVRVGGRSVSLSPKEYQLLKLLHSSPGRVFSSDEILEELWGRPSSYATRQDVQKYVYLLRKKLEKNPKKPELVATVRGFGYRLAI